VRAEAPVGIEPQRRPWRGEQDARAAEGAGRGAVEQQRVALRKAGGETPQYSGANAEIAD